MDITKAGPIIELRILANHHRRPSVTSASPPFAYNLSDLNALSPDSRNGLAVDFLVCAVVDTTPKMGHRGSKTVEVLGQVW